MKRANSNPHHPAAKKQKTNKTTGAAHFDAFLRPKVKRNKNEAVFDLEARNEYVTGFHARKQQRRKAAQEQEKEKDRQAKIASRKLRKQHMEKALNEMRGKGDIDHQLEPIIHSDESESEDEQVNTEPDTQKYEDGQQVIVTTVSQLEGNLEQAPAQEEGSESSEEEDSENTEVLTQPFQLKKDYSKLISAETTKKRKWTAKAPKPAHYNVKAAKKAHKQKRKGRK